jgi:hypothetical protein
MIKKVTITGADDTITPEDLVQLQRQFPFVEWGILVSRKNFGTDRFPSEAWLSRLVTLKSKHPELALACHLCGSYVKEFFSGNGAFISNELKKVWSIFDRVQLNTHGEIHSWNIKALNIIHQNNNKEFIFQIDNVNTELFDLAIDTDGLINISGLFDLSHGAGILPKQWPLPFGKIPCGYAGGLSPDNLEGQIGKIEAVVSSTPIWIDMETHVRSDMGRVFDLGKVKRCLEISSSYVNKIDLKRY